MPSRNESILTLLYLESDCSYRSRIVLVVLAFFVFCTDSDSFLSEIEFSKKEKL
jgi:hypothetical protein